MDQILAEISIHASSKELGVVFFQVKIPYAPQVAPRIFSSWSLVNEYCDYWKITVDPELKEYLLSNFTYDIKKGWFLRNELFDSNNGILGVIKALKNGQESLKI